MRNLTLFRCYRKVFSQLCPILVILLLISSIVPVSGLVSVLDYDANGNLVSDGRYAYTYDGFNQLIRINEGGLTGPTVAEYTYGPDKERIKKVEYNNGTATTSYYPSKDVIYTENSTGISATIYYYDDYVLVARKDPDGKNYFYHPNHLGSTDIVTNETGAVVEDIDYLPFGETQDDDRFLFTGKEKDSESGLMYYGARYYNPSTMRLTQPDTMLPDIYDPQQLNRYAYARNNPQTYVDPSGHFIDTLFDIGFIGWDIWNIIKSPRSRDNWVSLWLDTVGAFVPFATGLGAAYKFGSKASKIAKAGKKADGLFGIIGKAGKSADKFDNYMKNPAFRNSYRELKNINSIPGKKGGEVTVKSMDEGKALVNKMFPDYKNINSGLGASASLGKKRELGTFSIETKNSLGSVLGHGEGNPHAKFDHINIMTGKGRKITILVEDLAK